MGCGFYFLLIKPNSQRPTDDEQLRHTYSTSFYHQPKTKIVSLNSKNDKPEETKLSFIGCCLHELQSTV